VGAKIFITHLLSANFPGDLNALIYSTVESTSVLTAKSLMVETQWSLKLWNSAAHIQGDLELISLCELQAYL
jgi:hypothetical protein